MLIQNNDRRYQLGDQVATADKYRLYLCKQDGSEQQYLLQIAIEANHNGTLDRTAFFLRELKAEANRLEEEYAQIKTEANHFLNYDLGFPELIDSFVCTEQGGRRINILAFRGITDVKRMVPISNIVSKDHRRVDLHTSAWIMGKALKLLAFAHGMNVAIGRMHGSNILIEPEEHYVVLFDWSDARSYPDIPSDARRTDISQAAKAIITLVGGDITTRRLPNDIPEELRPYTDMLFSLAGGSKYDAKVAHQLFYELIDRLWERKFYPFTTQPL